jgi:acetyltransferase-like isoleucine patch superfamily enzyme
MPNTEAFIHPLAHVASKKIGQNTKIWPFTNILEGAQIGENCNICDQCFLENDVVIGNNVTLKCGVFLWDGVRLADNVFVGPNVTFTNDLQPRSKNFKTPTQTNVETGSSLGANSTILAGITIGAFAMTGIGSVVTKSVKRHSLVYGNPARHHAWIGFTGQKLSQKGNLWVDTNGDTFIEKEDGLHPLEQQTV